MKMHTLWFIVAAAALCGCVEERVVTYHQPLTSPGGDFATLPPAVQNSVRAQAGMAEIWHIVKNTDSPMGVYEIHFRNPELYPPLFVASDGSVLAPNGAVTVGASEDTIAASTGSEASGVKMDDLPPGVISSIRQRAPTAEIGFHHPHHLRRPHALHVHLQGFHASSGRSDDAIRDDGRLGARDGSYFFHTPCSSNCRVAAPGQSRFAAGLAGLGCRMRPILIEPSGKISSARFIAKSPTPMSHSGFKMRTASRRCASHARKTPRARPQGACPGCDCVRCFR